MDPGCKDQLAQLADRLLRQRVCGKRAQQRGAEQCKRTVSRALLLFRSLAVAGASSTPSRILGGPDGCGGLCMPAGVLVSCSREEEQMSLELESVNAEIAAERDAWTYLDGEMSGMSLSDW